MVRRAASGRRAPRPMGPADAGRAWWRCANQQFQRALNQAFSRTRASRSSCASAAAAAKAAPCSRQAGGSRDPKDPVPPPMVALTPEHYNRIARLLDHKIPVKLEFDIQARFLDDRTDSVNVVGEIEGGTQERRSRDDRRASRQLARRHGRHRQRGRQRRHDRGDAHPEDARICVSIGPCVWRSGAAKSRGSSGRAPTSPNTLPHART